MREMFVAESASSTFQLNIGGYSFPSCVDVDFMMTKREGFQ